MKTKIKCVDTRPPRESPEARHRPKHVADRMRMLDRYGKAAFLLPEGTKLRPGVPAYPIVSANTGCYHCGMMRMSYTRIGAAINTVKSTEYRKQLMGARKKLINIALRYASARDPTNRCNWAIAASKRYL